MEQSDTNVFIVGIKGVAMANLAIILSQMGKKVVGSDVDEEFITDENLKNITIQKLSDPIPSDTDLVIYSAAHGGTESAQVKEAVGKGITVKHQEEVLAEIMNAHEVRIAVCGSHGKTTTSGMLAFALTKLGVKPTYMVGTSTFSGMTGGAYGDGKYCVMEADEYAIDPPRDKTPKFMKLKPTHILCTNIDFDHPDVYESLAEIEEVFEEFFKTTNAKVYKGEEQDYSTITLSIPGNMNKVNAALVIAVLVDLGYEREAIKEVLKDFSGSKRRFELVEEVNGVKLYDDYAHHPAEIAATIDATRTKFPDSRIIIVFQPHTFSRTSALKTEFIDALSKADKVFIAPIFASAREVVTDSIRSTDLQRIAIENGKTNIEVFTSNQDLQQKLSAYVKRNDVVFTMGAGDIYKLKNDIIKTVKSV